MNRILKFRGWNTDYTEKPLMEYFDLTNLKAVERMQDKDIMQFTGLTDKNGKEIYEGDIVRVLYTDWASKSPKDSRTMDQYLNDISDIGEVVFLSDKYCVQFGENDHSSMYVGAHGFIEIIGNRFETPELLPF